MLPECVAIHHSNRQLCAEFDIRPGFAAHDRPHVWLGDADDPIRHAVRSLVVHRLLLAIEFLNYQQFLVHAARQPRQAICRLGEFGNDAQIMVDEPQLLADCFTHRARFHPPLLGNRQIGFAGALPVGSRLASRSALRLMQDVDDFLQLFSGLIQIEENLKKDVDKILLITYN
jgi:hypothetical protein